MISFIDLTSDAFGIIFFNKNETDNAPKPAVRNGIIAFVSEYNNATNIGTKRTIPKYIIANEKEYAK